MPDPILGVDAVDPNPPTQPPSIAQRPKTYDLSKPILTLPNGLTIRQHRHSDAEATSKHASNRKIARQMTNRFPDPYTVDEAHDFIAMCRNKDNWFAIGPTDPNSNNSKGMGQKLPRAWVIALDDEAIGGIGIQPDSDVHARKCAFGYWLGEEYWGRGFMSVVMSAFVEWMWETYPWLVKLQPDCYGWNTASAKLLEKCGFVLEGRLKCAVEKYGVLGDILVYGMVREGVVVTGKTPEI